MEELLEPRRYGSRQRVGQGCGAYRRLGERGVGAYIKVLQTIQFNLGEDGIDHSKAKPITTGTAEANAYLFHSREQ